MTSFDPPSDPPAFNATPELEARLTAWVLGECSAFEITELEALVAKHPEAAALHDALLENSTLYSDLASEESKDWKLPRGKRKELLKTLKQHPSVTGIVTETDDQETTLDRIHSEESKPEPQSRAKATRTRKPNRRMWWITAGILNAAAVLLFFSVQLFNSVNLSTAKSEAQYAPATEVMESEPMAQNGKEWYERPTGEYVTSRSSGSVGGGGGGGRRDADADGRADGASDPTVYYSADSASAADADALGAYISPSPKKKKSTFFSKLTPGKKSSGSSAQNEGKLSNYLGIEKETRMVPTDGKRVQNQVDRIANSPVIAEPSYAPVPSSASVPASAPVPGRIAKPISPQSSVTSAGEVNGVWSDGKPKSTQISSDLDKRSFVAPREITLGERLASDQKDSSIVSLNGSASKRDMSLSSRLTRVPNQRPAGTPSRKSAAIGSGSAPSSAPKGAATRSAPPAPDAPSQPSFQTFGVQTFEDSFAGVKQEAIRSPRLESAATPPPAVVAPAAPPVLSAPLPSVPASRAPMAPSTPKIRQVPAKKSVAKPKPMPSIALPTPAPQPKASPVRSSGSTTPSKSVAVEAADKLADIRGKWNQPLGRERNIDTPKMAQEIGATTGLSVSSGKTLEKNSTRYRSVSGGLSVGGRAVTPQAITATGAIQVPSPEFKKMKTPSEAQPDLDGLAYSYRANESDDESSLQAKAGEAVPFFRLDEMKADETAESLEEIEEELLELNGRLSSGRELESMSKAQAEKGKRGSQLRDKLSTSQFMVESNASVNAFSTFSLNVSDVSFQLAYQTLKRGDFPQASSVRIEEFVNAFDYGDPMPSEAEKVSCRIDRAAHPFRQSRDLVRISMRTAAAGRAAQTPLHLVLMLDNSGSMEREDREASLQAAVQVLAKNLNPIDRVTLIGFARTPRLIADALPGDQAHRLSQLVRQTPSEGGTNLEAALELAGAKALELVTPGAMTRIVLLTDGAANLGNAEPEELAKKVIELRERGVAFDACGMGTVELNDTMLEALTRKGDGRYYVLNRPEDAGPAFAEKLAGALRPAAKNVKVQVEFNPERVGNYRLLAYERHRLKKEDFRNDAVDAAEMAAADAGVAVYEVEVKPDGKGPIGKVSVRFRDMATQTMTERSWGISDGSAARFEQSPVALQLASLAAMTAQRIRGGDGTGHIDLERMIPMSQRLQHQKPQDSELKKLVEMLQIIRKNAP